MSEEEERVQLSSWMTDILCLTCHYNMILYRVEDYEGNVLKENYTCPKCEEANDL